LQSFSFLITRVSQENLAGRIVAINGYPFFEKTSTVTPIFIAFLKVCKHNYQLDQVLEILNIPSISMESP